MKFCTPGNPELLFRPSVVRSPRFLGLLQKGLLDDPRVVCKMPPPSLNAGRCLAYCREALQNVLCRGPTVYKIGLTADPLFRFYKKPSPVSPSPGYFYERDRFEIMYIVYAARTFEEAALMEAALIEPHLHRQGCRNILPGGEGRQVNEGPFFCYMVCKTLQIQRQSCQPAACAAHAQN